MASEATEPVRQLIAWSDVDHPVPGDRPDVALLEQAHRHRILGLVLTRVPPPLDQATRLRMLLQTSLFERQERTLLALAPILNAKSLKWTVERGRAVETLLYPRSALRGSADIDLIVAPGHHERLSRCLRTLGWRLSVARRYHGEEVWKKPHQSTLEVHFHKPFIDWSRLQHFSLGGRLLPALGWEDQMLAMSEHLTLDHAHAVLLLWCYDIARLVRQRSRDLDWRSLWTRAGRHGLRYCVTQALNWARATYGWPDEATPDWPARLRPAWPPPAIPTGTLRRWAMHLQAQLRATRGPGDALVKLCLLPISWALWRPGAQMKYQWWRWSRRKS
ncbi:MAG: nucleotidyltransferase family protein [Planctomycetes bacterium]|nr:nucleotidyltransferase family protein [Planctomycetota bacterium]